MYFTRIGRQGFLQPRHALPNGIRSSKPFKALRRRQSPVNTCILITSVILTHVQYCVYMFVSVDTSI